MKPYIAALLLTLIGTGIYFYSNNGVSPNANNLSFETEVKLDLEIMTAGNKAVNSSTQSINRYSSKLRELKKIKVALNESAKKLDIKLRNESGDEFVNIQNIDLRYLTPQLPYQDIKGDKFDIANLILAEYSRNGIGIPIQKSNDVYAQVTYSDDFFNDKGEYIFLDGKYNPNPGVLPKRLSVVNNCLRPGLWEFNASDAVGEMYHAWYELDQDFYLSLVESQTGIDKTNIPKYFNDPIHFQDVAIDFDRLRDIKSQLGTSKLQYNKEKVIGGYSSQDSRRKVQRNFFHIERENEKLDVGTQEELIDGDNYSLVSFQEPGIYDPNQRVKLEFNRSWTDVSYAKVEPKTRYSDDQEFLDSEYLEFIIKDNNNDRAMIIGNVPIALLSFQNDFVIPSFGVGVLAASEPIERRLLRMDKGPRPSFAFLAETKGEDYFMMNNHSFGYEQLFLRPVLKGEDMYLRITLVSYERITDLIEFEFEVNALKDAFFTSDKNYHPPIYETYQDDNTL